VQRQIKRSVAEFNKVNAKHKLKRVLRASEFKETFHGYNARLKCAPACATGPHVLPPALTAGAAARMARAATS
jgi:hypothetical protein